MLQNATIEFNSIFSLCLVSCGSCEMFFAALASPFHKLLFLSYQRSFRRLGDRAHSLVLSVHCVSKKQDT